MLIAKHISKRFSGVVALDDVSLELHAGKVNAIIGENGAGKSTLMKIFSGVYPQYEGQILYNGQPVNFTGTRDAEQAGIVIIHQELNLVPHLSITENIFLGKELTNSFGLLQTGKMNREAARLLNQLNLKIDPATKIAALRVGQQQLVEIAKALYTNASVIIMDEPTSAISDKEVDNLFSIIRQLRAEGRIVVYISHKLKEVLSIADRFIVLRDGAVVDSGDMQQVSQEALIQKMTGRNLLTTKRENVPLRQQESLSVKNLSLRHPLFRGARILKDISFNVCKGEIVGLYGLMGAGRTELLETIFGLHPGRSSGQIFVNGVEKKFSQTRHAIEAGIALVPEDRKTQGLILNQTIRSNISIAVLNKLQQWGWLINGKKEQQLSDDYIKRLAIKTSSPNASPQQLSGGNQQKIVLAKWLATQPDILLLDEPTRGIDINARTEIYKLMKSLADAGMAILVVSSELPEILAVSDRVIVLCDGELTASMPVEEASEAKILQHAIHKN